MIESRLACRGCAARILVRLLAVAICLGASLLDGGTALAQVGGGLGGFRSVGGIAIDAQGIVENLDGRALESLAAERRESLKNAGPVKAGELRKVSLAAVTAAVAEFSAAGKPIPADLLLLGGLERITHVFVDPDGHDIILAGPADKAAVDAAGNLVAASSGRPLLQLEDLIVALRTTDQARKGGILCSIDPTQEGLKNLQKFLGAQRTIGPNPEAVFRGMEQALGPQTVTVGGVPAGSRFALVLVAADYRMKRIGMGLEPSGIRELPSYLALVPPGAKTTALPRFWLEAEYEPLARDADELAWRIGGRRMKCLTENDVIAKGGIDRSAAPADKGAEKWCAAMTEHYDKLAAKHPVFAELVNCVDVAVVAALIQSRQLPTRAGLDLGPLLDAEKLPLPTYNPPTSVPTVASGIKKGTNWVLSASGGVQFQPWEFAANSAASEDVGQTRARAISAKADPSAWWWD